VGDALKHVYDILQDGPVLKSFLPLLPWAIAISSATKAAITDCLFTALAEQEKCEYVTADDRVIKTLQGFPIVSLASL
jgi:predicted nucleic acid-binding protein